MEKLFVNRVKEMEGRSILLANICDKSCTDHIKNIIISPLLKHFISWAPHNDQIVVYNLHKDFEYDHKKARVLHEENLSDVKR